MRFCPHQTSCAVIGYLRNETRGSDIGFESKSFIAIIHIYVSN